MLDYIGEIISSATLPIDDINKVTSFTAIGGKAIVINNYKKILTYSKDRIVLKLSNDELVVEGRELSIRQLSKSDISLSGNIVHIYYAGALREYEKME
ncbi:MAG: hypothetical protein E7361_01130 [Clostridiales bacterium]|nr:hypothetical protein [Clostridiales bacterium]